MYSSFAFAFWVCFLLASGLYLWLLNSQGILQSQLAVRESVIPQEVVAQVREANRLADTVIKIVKISPSPTNTVEWLLCLTMVALYTLMICDYLDT